MLNNFLLNIIWFCHLIVVCFVVGIPFFGSYYFLLMHAILVPFIMLHWLVNDNTCVLSLIELEIRKRMGEKIDKQDCFTCQLVNPIYDFTANFEEWSAMIYILTTILWLISVCKLYHGFKNGEIKSINDLINK